MTVESILAVFGTISSICLALSPIPTMKTIISSRSIGSFSVLPYSVTCTQAMIWVVYGRLVGDGKEALVYTNVPVAVIELGYILIFYQFVSMGKMNRMLIEIVGPVAVMVIGVVVAHLLGSRDRTVAAIGIIATAFNIAVYASPLIIISVVIRTQSVEFMPLLLSVAGTVCASIWLAWAVIADDTYVLIPSCAGVAIGLVQLGVYWKYHEPPGSGSREESRALVH